MAHLRGVAQLGRLLQQLKLERRVRAERGRVGVSFGQQKLDRRNLRGYRRAAARDDLIRARG